MATTFVSLALNTELFRRSWISVEELSYTMRWPYQ